jgi:hypothetical protein
LPVRWTQFTPSYGAFRLTLDRDAIPRARLTPRICVLPLTNLSVALSANSRSKLSNGQGARTGEVLMQVHEDRIYSVCYVQSIAIATVASATVMP